MVAANTSPEEWDRDETTDPIDPEALKELRRRTSKFVTVDRNEFMLSIRLQGDDDRTRKQVLADLILTLHQELEA